MTSATQPELERVRTWIYKGMNRGKQRGRGAALKEKVIKLVNKT